MLTGVTPLCCSNLQVQNPEVQLNRQSDERLPPAAGSNQHPHTHSSTTAGHWGRASREGLGCADWGPHASGQGVCDGLTSAMLCVVAGQ